MLVSIKRDWFGPGGKIYTKGTIEYNGPEDQLPSDAVVVSEDGSFPVRENTPKAGFGAKPLEEQVLDLIPGAGVTHTISSAGAATATKATEKEDAELKKGVAAGIAEAEKAAEAVKQVSDPVFADKKK